MNKKQIIAQAERESNHFKSLIKSLDAFDLTDIMGELRTVHHSCKRAGFQALIDAVNEADEETFEFEVT